MPRENVNPGGRQADADSEPDHQTFRAAGDVAPLRASLEDLATPLAPFTGNTDILDWTVAGADGFLDLTLKFDAQALLGRKGPVTDRQVYVMKLKGNLLLQFGGTP